MAEYIENVVSSTSKLDWAFPFQRTGAFPLDRSSVFSSFEDAQLYATGGADSRGLSGSSYAGQPVSVYDAETSTITLYVIDHDRSLKPVGAAPVGDDVSIEIVDGKVQLKEFGTGYYAFVPAVKDDEGNVTTPSGYEYKEGFKAGLEARVIEKVVEGKTVYEIAWYEPSSETLDGFDARLEALNNEVTNKANKADVYTKTETEALIAAAEHLKRKKVDSLEEIDLDAPDAEQFIYMILADTTTDGNDKYDEYMVFEGKLEKVGAWDISLDDYALKTDLNDKVDKEEGKSLVADTEIAKLATVAENAEENYIKSVSDKFTVDTDGKLDLKTLTVDSIDGLSDELNKKLEEDDLTTWVENNKETLPGLFDSESKEKLDGIEAGAQKNLFDKVNESQFEIVETDEGQTQLNVKEISISHVANLEDFLNKKVETETFEELEEDVNSISTTVDGLSTSITEINGSITTINGNIENLTQSIESAVTDIETALNDYVTIQQYNQDMDVVMKSITWTSLDNSPLI